MRSCRRTQSKRAIPMKWKWFERQVLHSKWRDDPVPVLILLWGLFIFYGTLLPFELSASGELIAQKIKRVWEAPLRGSSWPDVQANVLFFLPWGFLLALWRARRGAGFIASVAVATFSGALLSSAVELIQLFIANRSTS